MNKVLKKALCAILFSTIVFQGAALKGNGLEEMIKQTGKLMTACPFATEILSVIGLAAFLNKLTNLSFGQIIGVGTVVAVVASQFLGAGRVITAAAKLAKDHVPSMSLITSASDLYNKVRNFGVIGSLFGKQKESEQHSVENKNIGPDLSEALVKPEDKMDATALFGQQENPENPLEKAWKNVSDKNESDNQALEQVYDRIESQGVFESTYNRVVSKNNSLNKEREQIEKRLTVIGKHLVRQSYIR